MFMNKVRRKKIGRDHHYSHSGSCKRFFYFIEPFGSGLNLLVRPGENAAGALQRLQMRKQFLNKPLVLMTVADEYQVTLGEIAWWKLLCSEDAADGFLELLNLFL